MRQIELWLDEDAVIEDAEGNCYTGITHIDSRAGMDGYVETFDDEVINFSEMDEHMLADVAQLIEDYAPDGAAMGGGEIQILHCCLNTLRLSAGCATIKAMLLTTL